MLNWLPYLIYLTASLTALLSLRMFWEGGLLTIISSLAALGGAIWAAWYVATLSKQPQLPSAFKDLAFSFIWGGVSALGWIQRLVLRSEHGPALDSFESGLLILLLCSLALMVGLWLMIQRSQYFRKHADRM